jgi:cytochrome c-type biogenesis protein CcmF
MALWLVLLIGTWSIVVGVLGRRWQRDELAESSRRATLVLAPLIWVAILSLVAALLRRDLNVAYVNDHVSLNLSTAFSALAVLAGWKGFGLVCLGAATLFSIPMLLREKEVSRGPSALGIVVLLGTGALILAGDPFRRLGVTPVDGRGLDPLLLGPVLVLERPLSLLGYAALGMALSLLPDGLTSRSLGRWLGLAWLLLAGSAAVGCWQAYRFAGADGGLEWSTNRSVLGGVWLAVTLLLTILIVKGPRLRGMLGSPGPVAILVGLLSLVVGVVGGRSGSAREVRVKAGASVSIPSVLGAGYTLTHMGVSRFQMADRVTAAATLDASRNEKPVGLITSDKRQYFGLLGQPIEGPVTTAGIHRGVLEDVRVVFREAATNEEALYLVRVVPLASLVWLGMGLLILGGLLHTLGLGE